MSQWDIKALETNFEGFRQDRYPDLPISDAFERFTIRQILKNADLSSDEIENGILGGTDDGGVDGMYFFVNRSLVQGEADVPDEVLTAQLVMVQAKYESGFGETVITKLEAFTRDLLDHSRDVESLVHLNVDAREAILHFRENYTNILGSSHTMTVSYAYATKSDNPPNEKVLNRVNSLKQYVAEQMSYAKFDFAFWGCQELLNAARQAVSTTETMEITKQFTSGDGSAVCLAKLASLAALLRDQNGDLRRSLLEPNVRDYAGVNNTVNKAIRKTLTSSAQGAQEEFWWLNNGVTILATKCSVIGDKLVVEKPEVVNGLQTSYEIFQHFSANPALADDRNVLIRVIVPPDEQTRNKIIRATNSQTPISDLSLHATDPINFDIEEKLRLYQLYYERRKGEYRELKKPVDRIVSIQTLGRAMLSIFLQQPNNAYATPTRALKDEENYNLIFSEDNSRDLFVVCILIQRQADKYLFAQTGELKSLRSILRYYVSMIAACKLLQKADQPSVDDLVKLLPIVVKPIDASVLAASSEQALAAYKGRGGSERAAKGPDMLGDLLVKLRAEFAPKGDLDL